MTFCDKRMTFQLAFMIPNFFILTNQQEWNVSSPNKSSFIKIVVYSHKEV